MNDKKQLAAIGAEMAEKQQQPMCMAKRIEELEAQVRVMTGLLRDAKPYMDHCNGAGVKGYIQISKKIDAALAGQVTAPAAPEGWQLVPVEPTDEMFVVGGERLFDCFGPWGGDDDTTIKEQDFAATIYRAMLAATPKPGSKP